MTENEYLESINKAIISAEQKMDLLDVVDDHGEVDDAHLETIYESRFHCGTCIVRTVLEEIWPSVQDYIDHLRRHARGN